MILIGYKKILVESDYYLKNSIISFFQKLFFKNIKKTDGIKKLLIFRTGSIGDSICAFPAIDMIIKNFPEAQIDILTNTGGKNRISITELIDLSKINQVIDYFDCSKKQLFRQLKNNQYDLFIELPQVDAPFSRQIRNIFIVKLLKIKRAIGWQISTTYLFSKYQEKYRIFETETIRLKNILKNYHLKEFPYQSLLKQNDADKEDIKKILSQNNALNKNKNIGFVIGGKFKRNHWPEEYFAEVAYFLTKNNYFVFLIGGSEDVKRGEKIKISEKIINLCGNLTILQTAELIKKCSLIISNDTGPMHISYSVNTPVIALFSSREYPGKWFPPQNNKNKVFRINNMECSVCAYKNCIENKCMKKITPQIVINKIKEIMD